ncbi:MAG: hypothetical protein ACXVCP_07080 [Bdellovibrio sp.]
MSLKNKRILLIAAKFFGYENDIKAELISRGAQVDSLLDRPFNSALMKAFTKVMPKLTQKLVYFYYQIKFGHIFKNTYDYVFVVEGITLSREALERLKKQNQKCRFILYVWDSVANRPHIFDNKDFYNKVLTFDPEDAKTLGLTFRPLFFTPDFERKESLTIQYDISFIGTVHSDRFEIVSRLLKTLPESCRKYFFLYFHAHWFFLFNKIFNKAYKDASSSDFQFKTIPKKSVSSTIATSLVTLDIEHPRQVGLTMRTFEVLGEKRKLATTNASVKDYDFFNPNNIHVIDRLNPVIPDSFFKSEYQDLPVHVYEKYTLKGWINDIFDITSETSSF